MATRESVRQRRSERDLGDGEKICHIVHEDPDHALCGKDVTGFPWDPPGWPMCVVCVDLAHQRSLGRF